MITTKPTILAARYSARFAVAILSRRWRRFAASFLSPQQDDLLPFWWSQVGAWAWLRLGFIGDGVRRNPRSTTCQVCQFAPGTSERGLKYTRDGANPH